MNGFVWLCFVSFWFYVLFSVPSPISWIMNICQEVRFSVHGIVETLANQSNQSEVNGVAMGPHRFITECCNREWFVIWNVPFLLLPKQPRQFNFNLMAVTIELYLELFRKNAIRLAFDPFILKNPIENSIAWKTASYISLETKSCRISPRKLTVKYDPT